MHKYLLATACLTYMFYFEASVHGKQPALVLSVWRCKNFHCTHTVHIYIHQSIWLFKQKKLKLCTTFHLRSALLQNELLHKLSTFISMSPMCSCLQPPRGLSSLWGSLPSCQVLCSTQGQMCSFTATSHSSSTQCIHPQAHARIFFASVTGALTHTHRHTVQFLSWGQLVDGRH